MNVKLLPCPCCGSKKIFLAEGMGFGFVVITCEKCGITTGKRVSATIAAGIWNRRLENK